MGIKVIDTIKPMSDFPIAEASDIDVNGTRLDKVLENVVCQHDLVYIDALTNLLPLELSTTNAVAYCKKCGITMVTPKPEGGTCFHKYEAVVTPPTCTEQGYTTYTCSVCGESYVGDYVQATGHNYGEWVTTLAPTCTTGGTQTRTCACGMTESQNLNALGHSWSEWEDVHPAECEASGMRERKCSRCGEIETETIEATGHDWSTQVVVTPPTCTERGYTTHNCNNCAETYVDSYTEALGHTWGDWREITAAVCEIEGQEERTCTVCGEVETRAIPALIHNYVSVVTAPTCTESGYTKYTCSECGHSYTETIPALGHDWFNSGTKDPNCTDDGEIEYTCANCQAYKTEIDPNAPALGHTWVDATCTTPKTCSVCGETEGEALGHISSDWIIDVEPTAETEGSKHKECTRCGVVLESAAISKLFTYTLLSDGTYSVKATDVSILPNELDIPSTYNGKAVTVIEDNAFAGASITSATIPSTIKSIGTGAFSNTTIETIDIPLGVEYIGANAFSGTNTLWVFCEVYEQPDTWDENWATDVYVIKWHYICLTDGHTYEEVVVPPTCTEQGYNGHTCSACGHSYADSYVEALGHNWSDWSITLEPTCTETGTRRRDCTRCDVYETETIAALGHNYTSVVTAPTCTEQGYTTHTCSCGDRYVDSYTDALGHTSSDWIIDTEATETAEGSKHKECTVCGEVLETATIPKLEDTNTYLVTELGEYLTDEQGNLLIL